MVFIVQKVGDWCESFIGLCFFGKVFDDIFYWFFFMVNMSVECSEYCVCVSCFVVDFDGRVDGGL